MTASQDAMGWASLKMTESKQGLRRPYLGLPNARVCASLVCLKAAVSVSPGAPSSPLHLTWCAGRHTIGPAIPSDPMTWHLVATATKREITTAWGTIEPP